MGPGVKLLNTEANSEKANQRAEGAELTEDKH